MGRPGRSRGWSEQFLGMLESLRMGAQFQRGRRYARAGHVQQLTISSSLVVAQVLGSGEQVYRVRIAVRAFSAGQWGRVERILAGQALYVAKLLAGQVPDDIDRVFREQGLDLFPGRIDEIAMDCTCTDWDVPCRHLVAACYVLAESFDTDPFGIFAWRGRSREELLGNLRELRASAAPAVAPSAAATVTVSTSAPLVAGAPMNASQVADFWRSDPTADPDGAVWTASATPGLSHRPDALLDALDPLPLRLDGVPVVEWLRPAYLAFRESAQD